MSFYPPSAVERMMKIQEVILKAMSGDITWIQAACIIGVTDRTMRRWKRRYERQGYDGLYDRRRQRPSPKRVPTEQVERVLRLYREHYDGFNVRHFHQIAQREHGVKLSYSFVKNGLQAAGFVRKTKSRGRHRRRRERKACFGEMLHIDGSNHFWLSLRPGERQTLIAIGDDATSRLLYAQLWPSETTEAILSALQSVVTTHGIPMSLYSDRASWAFHTPKAGGKVDKKNLTHVGQVLNRLGVEHIPSYSPQARGRSERLNRTLQDRLVNELKAAKVGDMEAANVYLRERFIPMHNELFSATPKQPDTLFVAPGAIALDQILCERFERVVTEDNVVRFNNLFFQIDKQAHRATCANKTVELRRHVDSSISIWLGVKCLGRYNRHGKPKTKTRCRSAA